MTQSEFSYDSVPYPSYTFPQTHPDRLSTIGWLFGIETAHPENCRMLELGCGDGTNILSFAYALPESRFVGIDLSATHIQRAERAAAELQLTNAEFRQADVSAIASSELGEFDFIIAHGLYSWVPDYVRTHIHRIFRECLSHRGVGYISYNAYPGCHIREISSEIMKLGAAGAHDPVEKVRTGKAFLTAVAESAERDSLYQAMLKIELSHIIDRSEQNVFHDDLSDLNQPFYFGDFAANMHNAGLKFISEADLSSSHPGKLSADGQRLLKTAGDDVVRREQLVDLIICRRFRSSLVCRAEVDLGPDTSAANIRDYYLSGRVDTEAGPEDIRSEKSVVFRGHDGTTVGIDHPLTKAALKHLRSKYADRIRFDDLIAEAAALLRSPHLGSADTARTANILNQFHAAGLISFHRYRPEFAHSISDRPEASRFARWQIQNGSESVTSLAGINLVPGNAITKRFLSMLDGKHTREEVLQRLEDAVDVPAGEMDDFRNTLPGLVDIELAKFAEAGLLIG